MRFFRSSMFESNERPILRFPAWLKKPLRQSSRAGALQGLLDDLGVDTVCRQAGCPNRHECFTRGTATFLILGPICTRACGFCAIQPGRPGPPRQDEPERIAAACQRMGLKHVVMTSVTRDDLPDGGAGHFARTIRSIQQAAEGATVEVLIPDFNGAESSIQDVVAAGPDVLGHNIDIVERLHSKIKPQADYRRSLDVLASARRLAGNLQRDLAIKSGLMAGLGETDEEITEALLDLRMVGCDIVTIGQYLSPSPTHLPPARFVLPSVFDLWRRQALAMGFSAVACGPWVRSSLGAIDLLAAATASTGERSGSNLAVAEPSNDTGACTRQ